jgi:hypothetical protein
MFVQEFKYGPIIFALSCHGDKNICNDVPVVLNITFPHNPSGKEYPLPSEHQEEIISELAKYGLAKKCQQCLQKIEQKVKA